MTEYEIHAQALQGVQERLGGACPFFVWHGKEYKISPGTASRRKDLGSGGFELNADFRFSCLIGPLLSSDSPTITDLKDSLLQSRIIYLEDDYKPVSVDIMPGGLQIVVNCNSLNQMA